MPSALHEHCLQRLANAAALEGERQLVQQAGVHLVRAAYALNTLLPAADAPRRLRASLQDDAWGCICTGGTAHNSPTAAATTTALVGAREYDAPAPTSGVGGASSASTAYGAVCESDTQTGMPCTAGPEPADVGAYGALAARDTDVPVGAVGVSVSQDAAGVYGTVQEHALAAVGGAYGAMGDAEVVPSATAAPSESYGHFTASAGLDSVAERGTQRSTPWDAGVYGAMLSRDVAGGLPVPAEEARRLAERALRGGYDDNTTDGTAAPYGSMSSADVTEPAAVMSAAEVLEQGRLLFQRGHCEGAHAAFERAAALAREQGMQCACACVRECAPSHCAYPDR